MSSICSRLVRCRVVVGFVLLGGCSGSIQNAGMSEAGASGTVPDPDGAGGVATGGGRAGAGGGGQGGAGIAPPAPLDPGRVVLRRLNRTEYDNTVRDLLGTKLTPAAQFPDDQLDHGFDTLGSALSMSPALVEQAEEAARSLVDELLALPVADARRNAILVCKTSDDACDRQVLSAFARRAWRRPVAAAEIDRLIALANKARAATKVPDDGLRAALYAVLVSPHFLFKVERVANPLSPAAQKINDHELAVRLSYFLWATMPDAGLSADADAKRLTHDPATLRRQVQRLLDDPRASALAEHFAGQWLFTRAIGEFSPNPTFYKAFDETLRASMKRETERFFDELLRKDEPVTRMLTADFTFIDARLATHYGLPAPASPFARVSTAGTPRGGLLTQGSFLLATSQPERTSPVKRGAWVLEQLLCSPPPPAPPDVEAFDVPKPGDGISLRQRLEEHRANPSCAACHRTMDPIGLGLENFDGIGAYRTKDNGVDVNAAGTLVDGKKFSGARELSAFLAADPLFVACVLDQLAMYGIGRDFRNPDAAAYIEGITRGSPAPTWRQLIATLVTSEAFTTQRGEAAP